MYSRSKRAFSRIFRASLLTRYSLTMSLISRYLDPILIERLNQLQLSARRVVAGSTIGQHRSPVKGREHRVSTASVLRAGG